MDTDKKVELTDIESLLVETTVELVKLKEKMLSEAVKSNNNRLCNILEFIITKHGILELPKNWEIQRKDDKIFFCYQDISHDTAIK